MARDDGTDGAGENWELTKDALLEDRSGRKASKRVLSLLTLSPQRAVLLLALLLALCFVLLMALTIGNIQRVSTVREELERAQLQDKQSHATAWHNLSRVQHTLDTQLSAELRAIHSRLLNEGRDVLQPALQQLEELRKEQSRISTLLSTALEETQNLTEMFCTRCPAGWRQFDKTCYYFSTEKKSWVEARAACSMLGAHLAIVNSEMENKFLANHIMEIRAFWLGLNDMHQEGDWQWLDGQALSLSYVSEQFAVPKLLYFPRLAPKKPSTAPLVTLLWWSVEEKGTERGFVAPE
ncbi:hypothetical protein ASZ78_010480, partial [Callipepla squamata]